MKIFINAANVTGSGARGVVSSLIPALLRADKNSQYSLLVPDLAEFRSLETIKQAEVHFVKLSQGFSNDANRVYQLIWSIPRLANRIGAEVCLSLGDLGPLGLKCKNVIFLHTPHLVYDPDEMYGNTWPLLKRLYITKYFSISARQADSIIVQTPVMAERLANRFHIDRKRIAVISQPAPQSVLAGLKDQSLHPQIEHCEKPVRLLFLSAYYPHKNHKSLFKVVLEIKRRFLTSKVHFFLTLDESELNQDGIRELVQSHPDLLTNLGRLPQNKVGSALRACTALFLPSLAESYGLIYLEALASGVSILTSDRDFARWICQDLALYFDPLDPVSIVNAIESLPDFIASHRFDLHSKIEQRLSSFPNNWDEVAVSFLQVLKRVTSNSSFP
jgi:glycosyltransferase involved in cell wall biosynthesis